MSRVSRLIELHGGSRRGALARAGDRILAAVTYDALMSLAVGEVFAEYEILRVLGEGALGTVYLAQHPQSPGTDALKVLSAEVSADEQYRARFLAEIGVAAGLSHPNILGVHHHGEHHGQFWIAMEHLQGADAGSRVGADYRNGMPTEQALQIITEVGSALDHAHRRGLVHRNVKPANVFLVRPDSGGQRILLADFGIGRRNATVKEAAKLAVDRVAYAPPEQLMGEPVYPAADQYALACTAYHLLTGAPPYNFPKASDVINRHIIARPPSIGVRRPELAGMDSVFARAMAKVPTTRFTSCQEFTRELHSRAASNTFD